MPLFPKRHRFGIGSVMVGTLLISAILSEAIRSPGSRLPVAQLTPASSLAGLSPPPQPPASSSAGLSPPPQPPASSSAGLSPPPPPSSSSSTNGSLPMRCGDGKIDFGESCDPCNPAGRSTTDQNCNALCTVAQCGDGFLDRRRGEECDYVGLLVDEVEQPIISREESSFVHCTFDSTCNGGYCLYSRCWPLRWLAYWGWTDAALCPQTWSRITAEGGPMEPVSTPCNDSTNPRCREFSGDGCTVSCKLERCGDFMVQTGYTTASGSHYGLSEECDDGNTLSGDGCSERCLVERASSSQSITSVPPISSSPSSPISSSPSSPISSSTPPPISSSPSSPISSSPSSPISSSTPPVRSALLVVARTPLCGDGQLNQGEECDNGSNNADTVPGACRLQCRWPHCGDFVADYSMGEECDQGIGNSAADPDRCRPDCSLPRCGDRVVDQGEMCDDGNMRSGDGCGPSCTWERIDAIEQRCGDGRIQGSETCDDGNASGGDGCSASCQAEFVLGMREEVNPVLVAGDVICGDGVLVAPEECDDGNPTPGDGCSALCRTEVPLCGNGILEIDEECDDGDLLGGDRCDTDCRLPPPSSPKTAAPLARVIFEPQPLPYAFIPYTQSAPIGDTGPAAIAVMASGAAAGVGWMRRRKKVVSSSY